MNASANLLRSLAAIRRIQILDALRDGSKNVGQLVSRDLGCQAAVSTHLQVLRSCGLVNREKDGQQAVYSISPAVERLCRELDTVAKCVLERQ